MENNPEMPSNKWIKVSANDKKRTPKPKSERGRCLICGCLRCSDGECNIFRGVGTNCNGCHCRKERESDRSDRHNRKKHSNIVDGYDDIGDNRTESKSDKLEKHVRRMESKYSKIDGETLEELIIDGKLRAIDLK